MRNYRVAAATPVRVAFGVELVAGLGAYPETKPHAADFKTLTDELAAQRKKREDLQMPMLESRALLRVTEHAVRRTIRTAARSAQAVDGGRRGPFSVELFPDGVTPIVEPSGLGMVQPLRDLINRLEKSKRSNIDAYRTEWMPKLKDALANLQGAGATSEAARNAHRQAFEDEKILRVAHRREVTRIMGLVRAAFPDDTATQASIFPKLTSSGNLDGVEEPDPDPTPEEPSSPAEEAKPAAAPAPTPAPTA
jgi:hypothetical protein